MSKKEVSFTWYVASDPYGECAPDWMRSVAVSSIGTIFIPGAACGNEERAFLLAGFDGVEVAVSDGHFYFPSWWMRETFPRMNSAIDKMEAAVKSIHQ